jgi:hypothetical protein
MSRLLAFLAGAGFGVTATYMLDPDRGGQRRVRLRDGTLRGINRTGHVIDHATADVLSRTHGLLGEIRHLIHHAENPDAHLEDKIRAKVAKITGHPESVGVAVRDGKVTLQGPVLKAAADELLAIVRAMKGVKEVENQLDVRDAEESEIPQVTPEILGFPAQWMHPSEYPAPLLVMLASGGLGLAFSGLRRRDQAGWALAAGGAVLLGPAAAALLRRWRPPDRESAAVIRERERHDDAKTAQGKNPR